MVILPYDTKSKSRNADFISIAAERQSATLGAKGPVKLKNPPAVRPVNPKNPHAEGVSKGVSNSPLRISLFFSTIKRKQA